MKIDRDTHALAVVARMESNLVSALSCAGVPDPERPDAMQVARDLMESADDDQLENFGAAVAWSEAIEMMRAMFALGSAEAFTEDVRVVAVTALESLAELEGAGSSLCDYAEDCLDLLAAGGFAGERSATPNALLDLCGRTLEDIGMGDFGAAAGSLVFPTEMHRDHLEIREVAAHLRSASRSVR